MNTLHLKKLAQGSINYLTDIFNLSISTGQIPEIWHKAIIIPILKPGKANIISKNWRPISLLRPADKTLEKLMLPKILTHIPFHPAQHGFRPKHSTCTALSTITADIAGGFSRKNPAYRTVLTAHNLTAAFDNVDHQQLLECVFNTYLISIIRRWLYNYMQNRRAKVHFRQKESKNRKVKTVVVQGGVLSPALFNYYLADFLTPPPNIKLIKYPDDITIYTCGPLVADLINGLNIYLSQVLNYIDNKKLTVSTAKSTDTLFTPDTHEHHIHPQVKLADQVLPLEKSPKVLGVTLETNLTFTQHCNNIVVRVQQHNNVLKTLADSTWGCDKKLCQRPTGQLPAQISAIDVPSGRHHLWTLTGSGSKWHKIRR